MSSEGHAERLARAITATGLVQPVSTSFDEHRLVVIFRVNKGAEDPWLKIVERLIDAKDDRKLQVPPWSVDVSKPFFKKEDATGVAKLVFGWRIILISQHDFSQVLDTFSALVRNQIQAPPPGELEEMPLSGVMPGTDRNAPQSGSFKGASNLGKAPLIARRG